jgi:predicted Zn-dependent protease
VLSFSSFRDPATPEMYRNTNFTFRVLDSPVVNAFALPGGYVYVTRGLLAHVDNEAQLAVVLGHEIAHVAARHASLQARRSMWGQIGLIAGAILGQQVLGQRMPDIGSTILNAGGPAMQTFLLKYSREAEHESDSYGVNYAGKAGYAVGDSARFFNSLKRLSEREGESLPTFQSSHPDPGDRANHVRQIAASMPQNAANLGEDDFLRRIEGMIVGDDPRQGFVQNGMFYHPELRFQMPVAQGWKVENQPAAVVMAEPNGQAMMGLKMAPGARGREAAQQFVSKNNVQVTGSTDTQINGLPASVIVGRVATEEAQIGIWNAFIEYEGKVYSVLGYAPAQAFESMRRTFETVAAGFSPLRDPAVANVQPARLKIVRAERSAPFASFIPTSLPPSMTAEQLAILNQVNLNQTVPAGRPIKLPDMSGAYQPTGNYQPPRGYPSYPQNNPQSNPQSSYPPRYPNQGYPQQTYPPQTNPQQGYPQQGYPQQGYPNQSPQYPNYPQQTYPPQSPYPSQTYPPQSYPPQNYPQNYPQQYPQQGQQPNFPR